MPPRRIGQDDNIVKMYLHADGFYNSVGVLQAANAAGIKNILPPMLMAPCFAVELYLKLFKRGTSNQGYLKTHDLWLLWEDLDESDRQFILRVHREYVEAHEPDIGGKDPDDAFLGFLRNAENYFEDIRYAYRANRPYFGDFSGQAVALREAVLAKWPELQDVPIEISNQPLPR
jgi:hypothetical protein